MISKEWLYRKLPLFEPYILPVIVVLVGLTAFGLGRLSVAQAQPAGYTVAANCPE